MAENKVEIVVEGKDRASGAFASVNKSLGGIAKAASLAAAGGVAALAGIGVASVKAAGDFDNAMREVNTLIGDNEQQFQALSASVVDMSKKLGVDAVGASQALYQAISAGVPKENAVDFLAVASKAAIGGVTDTTTAVNGLTNIINAWGLSTKDAEKVADSMFAAVKGGKTTFSELSGAIYNVAPVAASVGVSFKDVNAAIEAATKQAVPTAQATTQLRQVMVELQKPGKELAEVMKAVGIADGKAALESKGLQGVLGLLSGYADKNGVSFNQMFSSVEAASAANLLAGKNASFFTDALKNQAEAAGASGQAFAEMNKSVGRQMERLKTSLNAVMIGIGSKLLPVITPLIASIADKLPAAFDAVMNAVQPVADIIGHLAGVFGGAEGAGLNLHNALERLVGLETADFLIGLVQGAQSLGASIQTNVMPIISQLVAFLQANLKPIMIAVGVLFAAWAVSAGIAAASTIIALAPVLLPIAAIVAAVAGLAAAWESNFLGIQSIVHSVLGAVVPFIQKMMGIVVSWVQTNWPLIQKTVETVLNAVRVVVETVLNIVSAIWRDHGDKIMTIVSSVWTIIKIVIETALRNVLDILKVIMQLITGDWSGAWDTIQGIATRTWQALETIVTAGGEGLKSGLSLVWEGIKTAALAAWDGITAGVKGAINGSIEMVNGFIRRFNDIKIYIPVVDIPLVGLVGGGVIGVPQIPEIPRLAAGGTVRKSGLALVGETGPELLRLPRGAQVAPLAAAGGGGYGSINVYIQAPVYGVTQLEDIVVASVEKAQRRGRL